MKPLLPVCPGLLLLLLAACKAGEPPAPAAPSTAAAPAVTAAAAGDAGRVASGGLPVLEILSEGGMMREGLLTIDAYEQDRLWLGIALETEAGTPLPAETVRFRTEGPAQILAPQAQTDEDGYLEFQVLVGSAGTQTVEVTAADVRREFRLNVIPNDFDQWLEGLPQAGLTRWNLLMEARVSPAAEGGLRAEFPEAVRALDGQTVSLAGFMLPLEPSPAQKHFLLSASPPNCFFHVPGGPSTVVEVFADTPVPGSFDPMRVQGRLELVSASEMGILYRLQAARPDPQK
jgi:hypothetical protein